MSETVSIFISDVHGCLWELEKLLAKLEKYKKSRIIFLGDLIGKGPAENEVVNLVRTSGHRCLLGNHELHAIRAYAEHPKEIENRLNKKNIQFIKKLPLYILTKKFLAVHAGIDCTAAKQQKINSGTNVQHKNTANNAQNAPSDNEQAKLLKLLANNSAQTLTNIRMLAGKPWHTYYKTSTPIIYGHWGMQGLHFTQNTIGLDSGCVYGGALSAYVLEAKELVQVKAKKCYA